MFLNKINLIPKGKQGNSWLEFKVNRWLSVEHKQSAGSTSKWYAVILSFIGQRITCNVGCPALWGRRSRDGLPWQCPLPIETIYLHYLYPMSRWELSGGKTSVWQQVQNLVVLTISVVWYRNTSSLELHAYSYWISLDCSGPSSSPQVQIWLSQLHILIIIHRLLGIFSVSSSTSR